MVKLYKYFCYQQYYIPWVDGVMDTSHNIYDTKQYLKLCTPICVTYNLYNAIFNNYIKDTNRILYEPIQFLDMLHIKYNLIKGDQEILKKITYKNDLKLV